MMRRGSLCVPTWEEKNFVMSALFQIFFYLGLENRIEMHLSFQLLAQPCYVSPIPDFFLFMGHECATQKEGEEKKNMRARRIRLGSRGERGLGPMLFIVRL